MYWWEEKEKEYQTMGNTRGIISLAWAGFALTNFVTVISVFAALSKETSVFFQLASSLFVGAGAIFAVAWALNETTGSSYVLRKPKKSLRLRTWAGREDDIVPNPREIYIKNAENCNILGTLVWSIGVAILLFDLNMVITAVLWA